MEYEKHAACNLLKKNIRLTIFQPSIQQIDCTIELNASFRNQIKLLLDEPFLHNQHKQYGDRRQETTIVSD
jgi:hypothetical protein